jgi:hypothetical protein
MEKPVWNSSRTDHGNSVEMEPYYESHDEPFVKRPAVSVHPVAAEHGNDEELTWKEQMKRSMDQFWILEATSLFISFAALAGIVGLLVAYDHQPLPQWSTSGTVSIRHRPIHDYSFSVTLNSILSLVATVYKIALGIPVAASLGQLKWVWFSEGHSLADFQMFDSARGVLGSLSLLWHLRGRLVN